MLSKRIITTLIGIPLLVVTIQWGGDTLFLCLVLISAAAALMELFSMTSTRPSLFKWISLTSGLFIIMLIGNYRHLLTFESAQYQGGLFSLLLTMPTLTVFTLLLFLYAACPRNTILIRQPLVTFLGVLYISLFLSYLILLYGGLNGKKWIFFLLIVLWCNDIGAYAIGRMWGRHRLSPLVSPHKTVEGAVGGLVFSLVAAVISKKLLLGDLGFAQAAALSLVIAVPGQAGDLCESALKRYFGVKDSGTMLPGHGGMLDRIDSLLFAAPLTYYCKMLIA